MLKHISFNVAGKFINLRAGIEMLDVFPIMFILMVQFRSFLQSMCSIRHPIRISLNPKDTVGVSSLVYNGLNSSYLAFPSFPSSPFPSFP